MKTRNLFILCQLLFSCTSPEHASQSPITQPAQIQKVEQQIFPEGSCRCDGIRWIEINSQKEFEQQINSTPKIIVLFSNPDCGSCKEIKRFWENQPAPKNWKFVYWYGIYSTANDDIKKTIASICTTKGYYPFIAPLINAKTGKWIEVPNKANTDCFSEFNGCTLGLKEWLRSH